MQNTKFYTPSVLAYTYIGLMAAVLAMMVLPVDSEFSRNLNLLSPHIMVGFFAFGLLSLFFGQERLMKVSFLAVGIIAFMLRSSALAPAVDEMKFTESIDQVTFSQPLSISQYATSNLLLDEKPNIKMILASDADILSIQGLTPDWATLLTDSLSSTYPHYYLFEDIGVHGLGIFSKNAFGSIDSFLIGEVVQVSACISGSHSVPELQMIAVQTTPPVNTEAYQVMSTQIDILADHISKMDGPVVTFGDFNNMPWSNELRKFQENAGISDSRRSQYPTYHQGAPHLFDRPVEHIFYSKDLQCLQYRVQREGSTYIGSGATFQLRSTNSAMVAR